MSAGFLIGEQPSSAVIAGAGGFALEVLEYVREVASGSHLRIRGVIDWGESLSRPTRLDVAPLCAVEEYVPIENEVVVVALGDCEARTRMVDFLRARRACLPPFSASGSYISPSARVGEASVICPSAIVNARAHVGVGVVINTFASVGHEATVDDFSVLSPYATLTGRASVGKRCFLATRATVLPNIRLGNDCIVDAHTAVRGDTPDRHIVSGRTTYVSVPLRARPSAATGAAR